MLARLLRLSTPMTHSSPNQRLQAVARQMSTTAGDALVLTESKNALRILTLNRPSKLNALNAEMVNAIYPALKQWEASTDARLILLKGNGKAFCAGGDVETLVKAAKVPETRSQAIEFFRDEYQCDNFIAKMQTPVVTFMDVGGGVGLSVHAAFKVATEKTMFAMPETTIGLFPDVGVNFLLSRMDGQNGLYLGLTSERLIGWDVFRAGVATHFVKSDRLPELQQKLAELDIESKPGSKSLETVNAVIEEFSDQPNAKVVDNFALSGAKRLAIDHCFGKSTVEEICDALKSIADGKSFADTDLKEWARKTKATIEHRSPTSCKVALMGLRRAKTQNIDQVFQTDIRTAAGFCNTDVTTDFVEGVEQVLVKTKKDKSQRDVRPAWQPSTLEETSTDFVKKGFFDETSDFTVPNLDTIAEGPAYKEYPHAQFALPSEDFIHQFISGEAKSSGSTVMNRSEIERAIARKWREKAGVAEKVKEVLDRQTKEKPDGSLKWQPA